MFYHSLLSDWNHGNAHFLRGVARELQARGHRVEIYEPFNGWSLANIGRGAWAKARGPAYLCPPGGRAGTNFRFRFSWEVLRP